MTIKDYQGTKIIILSKALGSRVKILNIVYFIFFTGTTLFLTKLLSVGDAEFNAKKIILIAFIVVIASAYLFAGYRFLNKAFQTEKLTIAAGKLSISKGGFSKKNKNYDLDLISNFRHVDKPTLTSHPLAGQSFDYLGFQTHQQAINEMHGENRLAFDYKGSTVALGENIYSWEFEELVETLNDAAGRNITAGIETEDQLY